jgi:hypothetical protein
MRQIASDAGGYLGNVGFDSLAHLHESPRQGKAILERLVLPPDQHDVSRLIGDDAVNRQSGATFHALPLVGTHAKAIIRTLPLSLQRQR